MVQLGDPFVGDRQGLQVHDLGIQPLPIRLAGGIFPLQVLVPHQLALHRVHQEHAARAEAVLFHHMGLVDIDRPHLGGQDHTAVVGDVIPGGPQAVPVQHRPHHIAVGEQDRGRSVPGLHHGGIVAV